MTRELLNKIAKANKVNLSEHTHIQAFINQNYTKLYIEFSTMEVCGSSRLFVCPVVITKSVAAIARKNATCGEPDAWEYCTQGIERNEDIK